MLGIDKCYEKINQAGERGYEEMGMCLLYIGCSDSDL
jgi:hypothetical protein